jgi:hypothetical protein
VSGKTTICQRSDFSAREIVACASAVQLESLISIRICSRDPGRHIPAKQGLIGIGSDPFASSGKLTMALATSFLVPTVFFLRFWAWLLTVLKFFLIMYLTVLKSFLPFGRFLLPKQTSPTHSNSLANVGDS